MLEFAGYYTNLNVKGLKVDATHLTFLIGVIPMGVPPTLEAKREQDINHLLCNAIADFVGCLALWAMRVYCDGHFQ